MAWGALEPSVPRLISPVPDPSLIRIQPIEDREAPSIPQGVRAFSGREVYLRWDPSVDRLTGVIGYRVFRDGEAISRVSETFYRDAKVEMGEVHRYQVAALDGVGNASALSEPVAVQMPPSVPQVKLVAYSYPNPAVGGAVPVIRAQGEALEQVKIRIFDLSGRLVENGNLTPIGSSTYEFPWTGPIASGIYDGVVEAYAGGERTQARIRIAVVR